jgi:hypothetical protein
MNVSADRQSHFIYRSQAVHQENKASHIQNMLIPLSELKKNCIHFINHEV